MPKAMFIVGTHAVISVLQQQPERVMRLYVGLEKQDKKVEAVLAAAKKQDIPIEFVNKQTLERLTQSTHHQGLAACCESARAYTEEDLFLLLDKLTVPPFLLVLDGVQDPHNLGACLRSADAAGVHAVIVPKDKAVGLTPAVAKVASGAAEVIPFMQVTNLARTLSALKEKGIWLYGAAAEASQSLFKTDLKGPIALILGAEGTGLRRLTRDVCDALVHIPMQGSVTSLNVSVATGIFLFEALRQRL